MTIGIDGPLWPLLVKIISRVLDGFNFRLLIFAQDEQEGSDYKTAGEFHVSKHGLVFL
jgi:hypothetical protein